MRNGKIFFNIWTNQLYTWVSQRKYIILLVILLTFVYWKWWSGGIRVAIDFPAVSISDLKNEFDLPRVWFSRGSSGFGEYSVYTLWSYPMDLLAGILSGLGLTFQVLEKIMFVIPTLLIGIYSIWNLLKDFGISKTSRSVATFFYLANTYILLLIDGGQLRIGLAYAWFPTTYRLFVKSIDGDLRTNITAGLALSILGMFDVRFIYILGILLAFRFIFYGWNFKWLKTAMITSLVFIGLNAYWILPFVRGPISGTIFSNLTQSSNLNFTQLKNTVSLLQPHWSENIFGKIAPFRKEFLLIPLLVFLAPFLKRKNKEVWFWTFVAFASVFLAKGSNPPFSNIYPWLFTHIPGFSLFRDSTKFFFLISLSYSVLIAFTVDTISKSFPKLKLIFPLFITIYLLYLVRPVYLSQMTGTFSIPRYQKEYSSLSGLLEKDENYGKIFWIPSRPPLGFASKTHKSLEANRLESMRPFVISTVGTYETQNFIREGNYIGELFDIIGVKYVAYPYFDPIRDNTDQEKVDYYNTFLSQIANLPWIIGKISDSPVPVFKTKNNQDRFFLTGNTYFVTGSDKIYQEVFKLGGKFANNALVFSEEFPSTLNAFFKTSNAKIILFHKGKLDLISSLISNDNFISVAGNLNSEPNKTDDSGWWKRESGGILWWRDFIQTKYGIDNLDFDFGVGWAVAEGDKQLTINNEQFTSGNILLARVMKSSKGGSIIFSQGDKVIGEVNTKIEKPEKVTIRLTGHDKVPDTKSTYNQADFVWINVGKLAEDGSITIKTTGDINVINSIVSIDEGAFNDLDKVVNVLYKDGKVLEWDKINDFQKKELFSQKSYAKVSYTYISSTHYQIIISGLSSPETLVFSDVYDPLWNLNGQSHYRIDSIINGFLVEKDGIYDLYFPPQIYVYYGLAASGLTLFAISALLLRKNRLKN